VRPPGLPLDAGWPSAPWIPIFLPATEPTSAAGVTRGPDGPFRPAFRNDPRPLRPGSCFDGKVNPALRDRARPPSGATRRPAIRKPKALVGTATRVTSSAPTRVTVWRRRSLAFERQSVGIRRATVFGVSLLGEVRPQFGHFQQNRFLVRERLTRHAPAFFREFSIFAIRCLLTRLR
jgi:hypothetical protein